MLDCTQMQQLQKFDNLVSPSRITNHTAKLTKPNEQLGGHHYALENVSQVSG